MFFGFVSSAPIDPVAFCSWQRWSSWPPEFQMFQVATTVLPEGHPPLEKNLSTILWLCDFMESSSTLSWSLSCPPLRNLFSLLRSGVSWPAQGEGCSMVLPSHLCHPTGRSTVSPSFLSTFCTQDVIVPRGTRVSLSTKRKVLLILHFALI